MTKAENSSDQDSNNGGIRDFVCDPYSSDDRMRCIIILQFEGDKWQELKELIVHDKSSGIIVYCLVDHPYFQGETINICRTTNQVYQSELEYEINWKLKDQNSKESNDDIYYSE
ncbi:unnamed protein product [Rotaria socialis]|uniref:Uncharacterized protein n=1 Tax=Rotaria socialis TaxID=392032 RepID=A0A818AEA3_9BILA|nr:unnamed protein product [Rotaria socialis]